MPSDKRNSIMDIATGLISSLFNVASSQDVHFCQPQQIQCSHHGFTKNFPSAEPAGFKRYSLLGTLSSMTRSETKP